jgi:hypothetical protein
MGPGLALGLLIARGLGGLLGFFGLFLRRLGWGIPGSLFFGHRLPSFLRIPSDARLQLLGIDLLGTRPKEAALVERDRVLQIPPDGFQLLDPRP